MITITRNICAVAVVVLAGWAMETMAIESRFFSVAGARLSEEHAALVEQTHSRSTERRMELLRAATERDTLSPSPPRGDIMWALSLLYLNERVEEANERILEHAATETPFAYFGVVDYVRILAMFNSRSSHYPGRLTPEAESAMKEILWDWARAFEEHWAAVIDLYREIEDDYPRLDAGDPAWIVHASENHDLIRRATNYVIFSVLKDDPDYRDQECANGFSVAEHYESYNRLFRRWLRERATKGLWMEMGAEYAGYSYPTLFNLYDLSPDPVIRERAKMFLDISLIDEAQMSFRDGFRGGGKSRPPKATAGGGTQRMMNHYKALLYGEGGGSRRSRVVETSSYHVPDIAVFLRNFGDAEPPFLIRNRVLGESSAPPLGRSEDFGGNAHPVSHDSAFINYCYKTPRYMLGGTLQNPANVDSVITRQNRWSGMVFNDGNHSRVTPWPESTPNGTRVFNAYWNVQHENLMIVQKLDKSSYMRRMMVFFSPALERVENGGWVFATDGEAFVAVKAVGGNDRDRSEPHYGDTEFLIPDDRYAPIVFYAGCLDTGHESLEEFQNHVLNEVQVQEGEDQIVVSRPGGPQIRFFTDYRLPLIDDADENNPYAAQSPLRTPYAYDSPYLQAEWGGPVVTARWGEYERIYDFR